MRVSVSEKNIYAFLPVLFIVLFFVVRLASLLFCDVPHLVVQFADDAFYYFKIAQNIVSAHTATFDGQSATNGFHPLWLAAITPWFLMSSDHVTMLRVVGVFSATLLLTGYLVAALFLVRGFSLFAGSVCTVFAVYFAHVFSRCNLEISLLIPLSVAALLMLSQLDFTFRSRESRLKASVLGWLIALLQLSRLDAVFLGAAIVVSVCSRCLTARGPGRLRFIITVAGPPLVTGLAYLAANYVWFGHLVPVSGISKSMSEGSLNYLFLKQMFLARGWIVYSGMLILALFHLILFTARREIFSRVPEGTLRVSVVVSAFIVMYTAYHAVSTSWFLWDWYLYPALFVTFFVLPIWLDMARVKIESLWRGRATFAIKYVTILACCIVAAEIVRQTAWQSQNVEHSFLYQNYRLAVMLNTTLKGGPRLAMGDRAGSLAYFYRGPVTQLEGLVSDYELPRAIARNQLSEYISARDVKFIVSWVVPEGPYDEWTLTIPDSRLSLGPHADLRLCFASEFLRDQNPAGSVYVWKWPGACGERGKGNKTVP